MRFAIQDFLYETWYLRLAISTCSKICKMKLAISCKKIVIFRDYSATRNFFHDNFRFIVLEYDRLFFGKICTFSLINHFIYFRDCFRICLHVWGEFLVPSPGHGSPCNTCITYARPTSPAQLLCGIFSSFNRIMTGYGMLTAGSNISLYWLCSSKQICLFRRSHRSLFATDSFSCINGHVPQGSFIGCWGKCWFCSEVNALDYLHICWVIFF